VWALGTGPLSLKPYTVGRGRPTKRLRRDDEHRPVTVKQFAFDLPPNAWPTIAARRGAARRGLWQSHHPTQRDQRAWIELCRRHSVEHLGVGGWHRAVAAQAMVWSRAAADTTEGSAGHKPVSVKQLALALPRRVWQRIGWREGSAELLSSRLPACVCAPPIAASRTPRNGC
jgi:hypothetical protein